MKRFDYESNYNRHIKRMSKLANWASMANLGTIVNLLKDESYAESEIGDYINFLAIEKKFKTAHTLSAIQAQTDLIGYQRSLPKSAFGYVIVSHTDENGANRLANLGSYFFDPDASSDYDNLSQNTDATSLEQKTLVPWTADSLYSVPEGTVFTAESGTTFISTETVEIRALKEPYSTIKNDTEKYAAFIEAGGWNGIKYLKVPVIQGKLQSTDIGIAEGTRFESFSIDSLDIERAASKVSKKYFTVTVTPMDSNNNLKEDEAETWEKVDNIKLASASDKVFDIKILSDNDQVLIRFGDGITGQTLPANAVVTLNYLETAGKDGNVETRYSITSMAFPDGYDMIDPRTGVKSAFLSCTNTAAIMGGADIEGVEDIKLNAPSSYLKTRAVATRDSYYEQICMNSPASLLACRVFCSDDISAESYGEGDEEFVSSSESNILQEIISSRPALLISAIKANGKTFDDPETELIEPLEEYMSSSMAPIDSLTYIEPNIVKIRPQILIATSDTVEESTLAEEVQDELAAFTIFGRNFEESMYLSQVDDTVHANSHVKYINTFYEAEADVDLTPEIMSTGNQSGISWLDYVGYSDSMDNYDLDAWKNQSLLAFNFSFDPIFAQNTVEPGFKNFKYNAPYLLRVDLKFSSDDSKNRTLFLFDHRTSDSVSLEDAKIKPIDSDKPCPTASSTTYGTESIDWVDVDNSTYSNSQVRVAQFPAIDHVTNPEYMAQLANFGISPSEIRPYTVSNDGTLKLFTASDVASSDQVSTSFGQYSTGSTCYEKNWNYIPKCDIQFTEDYDDTSSDYFAKGKIILPLAYVFSSADIDSLKVSLENITSFSKQETELYNLLKDELTISVYALPIQLEFDTEKEYDLIALDTDNMICNEL